MFYLFQYSAYVVVLSNKSSYQALKYSSNLVKNNPWQSLLVISVSFVGFFGTDYISSLIFEALLRLGDNQLLLWIYAFKSQMLLSFFIFVNIIGYLNIDYAYQRKINNT